MAFSKLVGAEVKRKEDPRLISGKGTYVPNLKLTGMHYVAFVRSPYAHALIQAIDATAALTIPGVVAVVTGADLVGSYDRLPISESDEIKQRRVSAIRWRSSRCATRARPSRW